MSEKKNSKNNRAEQHAIMYHIITLDSQQMQIFYINST